MFDSDNFNDGSGKNTVPPGPTNPRPVSNKSKIIISVAGFVITLFIFLWIFGVFDSGGTDATTGGGGTGIGRRITVSEVQIKTTSSYGYYFSDVNCVVTNTGGVHINSVYFEISFYSGSGAYLGYTNEILFNLSKGEKRTVNLTASLSGSPSSYKVSNFSYT